MCYNSFTMIHKGCYEIKYLYTYYIINIWCIIFNNNNICSLVKYLCPTRVVNNDEILNVCLHDLIFSSKLSSNFICPPDSNTNLTISPFQYLMDTSNVFDDMFTRVWKHVYMCLTTCLQVFEIGAQVKFETTLKEIFDSISTSLEYA